jgi:hypothetical protein
MSLWVPGLQPMFFRVKDRWRALVDKVMNLCVQYNAENFLINPLKPRGNYMYHLPVSDAAFCICGFLMILNVNRDYFLKQRY